MEKRKKRKKTACWQSRHANYVRFSWHYGTPVNIKTAPLHCFIWVAAIRLRLPPTPREAEEKIFVWLMLNQDNWLLLEIMENKNQEDLDLLLSLDEEERVLETPPGSPSAPPGEIPINRLQSRSHYWNIDLCAVYLTDEEESPKRRRGQADLSDFRSVVQDCIDYNPKPLTNKPKCDIEKFSGLRLRSEKLNPFPIRSLSKLICWFLL